MLLTFERRISAAEPASDYANMYQPVSSPAFTGINMLGSYPILPPEHEPKPKDNL